MCCEDVRIGRQIVFQERVVVLGAVAVEIAAPDPNRIYLLFSSGHNTGAVHVSTLDTLATQRGIKIGGTVPFLFEIDQRTRGSLVNARWYGIASLAANLTVIEGFAPKELCKKGE